MDSWISSLLKLIYKGKALLTLIFFSFHIRKKPPNFLRFFHQLRPVDSGDNRDFYHYNYEAFSSIVFIHQWLLFCEKKQAVSTNYKDAQYNE